MIRSVPELLHGAEHPMEHIIRSLKYQIQEKDYLLKESQQSESQTFRLLMAAIPVAAVIGFVCGLYCGR